MRTLLRLGTNLATRHGVEVPLSYFQTAAKPHVLIMGSSGDGKSCTTDGLARDFTQYRETTVIEILCKSGDYERRKRYVAAHEPASRVILVDPNDPEFTVPINPLEPMGGASAEAWAEKFVDIMRQSFGEADSSYKPWYEEWMPAVACPLIQQGLTPLEMFSFLSLRDARFRNLVLKELGEESGFYGQKFAELRVLPAHQQATVTGVVRTRASKFWSNPVLKAMFGMPKSGIHWPTVFRRRAHVLVNAGRTPMVSESLARMLGATILMQILESAVDRGPHSPPVRLIIDEWQRICSPLFADALQTLRAYNISCTFVNQNLAQLRNHKWPDADVLVHAARHACGVKILFSLLYEDAQIFSRDLWSSEVDGDEIKHEIAATKFRPVESERVIRSKTRATGCTKAEAETDLEGHGEGETSMEADGLSSASAAAFGSSEGFGPDGDWSLGNSWSNLDTAGSSSVRATGSSSSSFRAKGRSRAHGESEVAGEGETVAPFMEAHEFTETTSRTYRGLDEQWEKRIGWLVRQEKRHCWVQVWPHSPVPVYTRDVHDIDILKRTVNRYRRRALSHCAIPLAQALTEIESRVPKMIAAAELKETQAEAEAQRAAAALEVAEGYREPVKPPPRRKRKDASL